MITDLEHDDSADLKLKNFLQAVPKVELHAHLNGSLSEATMKKLIALKQQKCCDNKVQSDLNFICSSASSLSECFKIFSVIHEITDSPEAIKMATVDVITDFYNDGVCHLEIRSTPKEVSGSMSQRLYIQSVLAAIKECKDTFPSMSVKLILSVNRGNPISSAQETVNLAVEHFSAGSDVVGLDLSGNPLEGNVSSLIPLLQYGKNAGLKLSLHIAETSNTSDEVSKLLELRPDRIGHGTYLHPSKGGTQENFSTLQQLKIPLEVCLTSNIISGTIPSYSEHHFPIWRQMNYPCVLCTDDKGIFNTSLSNEYYLAEQNYCLGAENIWSLALESINYSFLECKEKHMCEYFPLDCGLEALDILYALSNFPTEEFLNEHCSLLLQQLRCHRDFLDGCSEVVGQLNYFTIHEGMLEALSEACDQNSALRKEYLRNVECYRNTTMKLHECVIDIQSRIDLFEEWERNTTDSQNIEEKKYGCIGGPLRRRCFLMVVFEECGEEATEVLAGIFHTISRRITELLCPREMVDAWNAEIAAFFGDNASGLLLK